MSPANTATAPANPLAKLSLFAEFGVPVAVMAIIVALITPMPGMLLDFLIVIDIMLSVIVMMVAVYIRRPVEFSVFPTMLLLLTLYRLALNISSARLILLNGNTGTSAAGHVIEAFGNFVVGGNYIIGTVIFLVSDRHSVRGHQSRRGAYFGGHRALHPGRAARQADVDRRRPEFRPDRRNRSSRTPQAIWPPKPNSTEPWTAPRVSPSATPWPAS